MASVVKKSSGLVMGKSWGILDQCCPIWSVYCSVKACFWVIEYIDLTSFDYNQVLLIGDGEKCMYTNVSDDNVPLFNLVKNKGHCHWINFR